VFDLVAKRFLAVFHPPARYARTTVITLVEEERFRTRWQDHARGRVARRLRTRAGPGAASEDEAEGGEIPCCRGSDRGAASRPDRGQD